MILSLHLWGFFSTWAHFCRLPAGTMTGQWRQIGRHRVGFPVEWHLDIWCAHCSAANCVAAKAALANESLHHPIVFSCDASDSASPVGQDQATQKPIWTAQLLFCAFFPPLGYMSFWHIKHSVQHLVIRKMFNWVHHDNYITLTLYSE